MEVDDCVRRLEEETWLSPQQARIYCLKKGEGLSVGDIAGRLGIKRGSVKSQLQRIRVKTRESRRHVEIMEEYEE